MQRTHDVSCSGLRGAGSGTPGAAHPSRVQEARVDGHGAEPGVVLDITRLLGPKKWSYYYLYVIMDIYSRYVVGWMVADRENSALAGRLIQQSCLKHGVQPRVLTSARNLVFSSMGNTSFQGMSYAPIGAQPVTHLSGLFCYPGPRSIPFPHHTGHCSLINPVECPIVVDRFRTEGESPQEWEENT